MKDWYRGETESDRLHELALVMAHRLTRYDRVTDHACVECVPSGQSVIGGFACAWHRAAAFLVEAERESSQ